MTYFTCLIRSIEFDEFLEFVIARQGDGRDVHNEILQVCIIIFFFWKLKNLNMADMDFLR